MQSQTEETDLGQIELDETTTKQVAPLSKDQQIKDWKERAEKAEAELHDLKINLRIYFEERGNLNNVDRGDGDSWKALNRLENILGYLL